MKFFTIGYGNRTPAEFINALQAHGVKTVVDVRIRPDRARLGCYVMAKTPDKGIQKVLTAAGIAYAAFPELGKALVWHSKRRARKPPTWSAASASIFSTMSG